MLVAMTTLRAPGGVVSKILACSRRGAAAEVADGGSGWMGEGLSAQRLSWRRVPHQAGASPPRSRRTASPTSTRPPAHARTCMSQGRLA